MRRSEKSPNRKFLAYVIGIALGDGNLSNPNGRATRLRITCDIRYQNLIQNICKAIKTLLPQNKINLIKRSKTFIDISCYSNQWEQWLGWKVGKGSKYQQNASVPRWILRDKKLMAPCLRGLIETDGSVYQDRGYPMINFITTIPQLADDVLWMLVKLGFNPRLSIFRGKHRPKYTVRVARNALCLAKMLRIKKA